MTKKITELDPALSLTGAEIIPMVQNVVTRRSPLSALADWVLKTYQGFLQAGVGAVARTSQDKLRESVSVKDFGAVGDGVTNDAAAIQLAIDANLSVFFPAGDYLISTYVTLREGGSLYGAGIASTRIIAPRPSGASIGALYANSGSAGTQIDGITLSDFEIDGQVSTLLFSEFRHLVSLNGVKNVLVERVKFTGFRGDGIYIGSGIAGGDERHNTNVTVRDCIFDGVNFENRNGISVVDGNGVFIENNTFLNCSKSTMPGPIDIEPDGNAFAVVKNIKITNNNIQSFGGSHGISCYIPAPLTSPLSGLTISDNYIAGATKTNALGIFVQTAETLSSSTKPMGIVIFGNTVSDTASTKPYPFAVYGVSGISIIENSFVGGSVASLGLTTATALSAINATVADNIFYKNGNSSGSLTVGTVDNVEIRSNVFQEPNDGTSTIALRFFGSGVTTTSTRVKVIDNTFVKGASQIYSVEVNSHTLDRTTNTQYGNRNTAPLTNSFLADYDMGEVSYNFTPVIADAATGGNVSPTVCSGKYTRVGNLVFYSISCNDISTAGMTAGNGVYVRNLPFAAAAVYYPSAIIHRSNVSSTTGDSYGLIFPSTNYMGLFNGTTGAATPLIVSQITSGSGDLYISGQYAV